MSLFPRFAMETYPPAKVAKVAKVETVTEAPPPAKVAKVAKPDRYFSRLATLADPSGEITKMESEYFHLLTRYCLSREDETAFTMDEVRRLVDRLDELYQALRRNGVNPPVRLPVERNRDQVQRGLAL